jgi:hypothetical protein
MCAATLHGGVADTITTGRSSASNGADQDDVLETVLRADR